MICSRCEGTGYEFRNVAMRVHDGRNTMDAGDVRVCRCCGNSADAWHHTAGHHDSDTFGQQGPYAYNGGFPECA